MEHGRRENKVVEKDQEENSDNCERPLQCCHAERYDPHDEHDDDHEDRHQYGERAGAPKQPQHEYRRVAERPGAMSEVGGLEILGVESCGLE